MRSRWGHCMFRLWTLQLSAGRRWIYSTAELNNGIYPNYSYTYSYSTDTSCSSYLKSGNLTIMKSTTEHVYENLISGTGAASAVALQLAPYIDCRLPVLLPFSSSHFPFSSSPHILIFSSLLPHSVFSIRSQSHHLRVTLTAVHIALLAGAGLSIGAQVRHVCPALLSLLLNYFYLFLL